MASLAYHRNKRTGAVYAYSVESYWDKAKKAPRNKQVCLGRLDEASGEIVPSRRRAPKAAAPPSAPGVSAEARVAGPAMLLGQIAAETGLAEILGRCFPVNHAEILSVACFIVQKGLPLSRIDAWSEGHVHPHGAPIASQRVSELMASIKEGDRQRFLSLWLARMAERDYLCYDITSISSYSKANEYVRWGYNRDGERLPQINLAMLFGQNGGLPAYYRRMPGNISDVATLRGTMKSLDFLGSGRAHFVLDRGFHSRANIDGMLKLRHHFTMAVPSGLKWVEEVVDGLAAEIQSPANYRSVDDSEALFMATKLLSWGEGRRRVYLHVYNNARRAAEEFDELTRRLLAYKEEVESERRVERHEEHYSRFLVVKETPRRGPRASFNEEAVAGFRRRHAGFFYIMSSKIRDPMEALRVYRAKEAVENSFDDLKNQLDMGRLRVHSSSAMDSRIFLQFIALILLSQIRNVSKRDKKLRNLTVREIMEQMENLVQIKFSGRHGHVLSEASPMQRHIMDVFGLTRPT
jgi:transposase